METGQYIGVMLDADLSSKNHNLALKLNHLKGSLPLVIKTGWYAFVFYRNILQFRGTEMGSCDRLADL